MTKTFEIPFTSGVYIDGQLKKYVYKIRVTDKMEERDSWKRVEAIRRAEQKYNKEHCAVWTGTKYLIRSEIKEV